MARPPPLSTEENERLRIAVRALVDAAGNQARVAQLLGAQDSTVSRFLAGTSGASPRLRDAIDAAVWTPKSPSDPGAIAAARTLPTETLLAIVRERMTEARE